MSENEKIKAWADIREAARTKHVLTGYGIGIETKEYGNLSTECLKVDYNGVYGYIPIQLMDTYELKGIQMYIGTEIVFVVKEAISGEFVGDRVAALERKAATFWKTAKVGDVYNAFIVGVDSARLYLSVEGVRTTLAKRYVSYSYIEDLTEFFEIGDTINVQITEMTLANDEEPGRILVDSRILESDPWNNISNYKIGNHYLGIIKRIHPIHGFFIEMADSPGLIVRSNIPAYSGRVTFKVDDQIRVRIVGIDTENRIMKVVAYTVNTRKVNDLVIKKAYAK